MNKSSRLEKAILILHTGQLRSTEQSHISGIDPRALLIVTLLYLVSMLSIPVVNIDRIIWFAIYPIISAPLAHLQFSRLLKNSLYVFPLLLMIGIFNPILDHRPAFSVFGVEITTGWITFISIILRGLLATQALLLLIRVTGFNEMCYSMRRLGIPAIIVTQLLMVYRYISVLLQEALTMQRARLARGYGQKAFKPLMWGNFVGQLLLRTLHRGRRIHLAMKARGFNGEILHYVSMRWATADTVFCMAWIPIFLILRFYNLSGLFSGLTTIQ